MNFKFKRNPVTEKICLISTVTILSAVFLFLFTAQIHSDGIKYQSDIILHMNIAMNGKGYSLLYRLIELLYKIFDSSFPIAVLETIMTIGTWLVSAKFIDSLYKKNDYFLSAIITLPTIFLTGIFIPFIYGNFYFQQIVTQPHHNITYTGMRFFAVLAMIVFYKVFETYLHKINWYHWLSLALLLAFSTSVKPSFFYGFALTLLIFLIIDFVKTKFKLKPFTKMVILGCVVFPSLFIMFYQSLILFSKPAEDGGSSIVLVWGEVFFSKGFVNTMLKLLCGLSFPTLVGFANNKKLLRTEKFIYAMYSVQLLISIIFAETGKRANDGNFKWGLYCAAFFLFLIAFARFADNLMNHKLYSRLYLLTGTALMSAHILSGALYFAIILIGKVYTR